MESVEGVGVVDSGVTGGLGGPASGSESVAMSGPSTRRVLDERARRLSAQIARAQVELAETLRELSELDEFGSEWRSVGHWASWNLGLTGHEAKRYETVAGRVGELPALGRAMGDGVLTLSAAASVMEVATPETDADLAELCRTATGGQIQRICRDHREAPEAPEPEEFFRLSPHCGGHRVSGWIAADTAETMNLSLEAALQQLWADRRSDQKHKSQRTTESGRYARSDRSTGSDRNCEPVRNSGSDGDSESHGATGSDGNTESDGDRESHGATGSEGNTESGGHTGSECAIEPAAGASSDGECHDGSMPRSECESCVSVEGVARGGSSERPDTESAAVESAGGDLSLVASGDEVPRPSRVDALRHVLNGFLQADGATTGNGGDRWMGLAHIDVDSGGRLGDGTALTEDLVERILCDAGLAALISIDGRPAWITDRSPTVPGWMRRVINTRSRGVCEVVGCTASGYLEGHHIWHRNRGGDTVADNIGNTCPWHHRLAHTPGYELVATPSPPGEPLRLTIVRSDGTDLTRRPPPCELPDLNVPPDRPPRGSDPLTHYARSVWSEHLRRHHQPHPD